jgi:hypothetical protein
MRSQKGRDIPVPPRPPGFCPWPSFRNGPGCRDLSSERSRRRRSRPAGRHRRDQPIPAGPQASPRRRPNPRQFCQQRHRRFDRRRILTAIRPCRFCRRSHSSSGWFLHLTFTWVVHALPRTSKPSPTFLEIRPHIMVSVPVLKKSLPGHG